MLVGSKRCLVSVRGERAALGWAAVMFVAPLPGADRVQRSVKQEGKLQKIQ